MYHLIFSVDVNECSSPGLNNCDQLCANNFGSFVCLCTDGFIRSNGSCTGIRLYTSQTIDPFTMYFRHLIDAFIAICICFVLLHKLCIYNVLRNNKYPHKVCSVGINC